MNSKTGQSYANKSKDLSSGVIATMFQGPSTVALAKGNPKVRIMLPSHECASHQVETIAGKTNPGQEPVVAPAKHAGVTQSPNHGNGGYMHVVPKDAPSLTFRSMSDYENKELRAVKFPSDGEADRALVLIGKSPTMKKMPFLFADALTFIVPEEAVQSLKSMKLRFKASRVLDMDDLDEAERSRIRHCQSL